MSKIRVFYVVLDHGETQGWIYDPLTGERFPLEKHYDYQVWLMGWDLETPYMPDFEYDLIFGEGETPEKWTPNGAMIKVRRTNPADVYPKDVYPGQENRLYGSMVYNPSILFGKKDPQKE